VEQLPWVPVFLPGGLHLGQRQPEDDDVDYEPMEEADRTKEEALARSMSISKAEVRAKWISPMEAIHISQQATTAPTLLAAK
jgi:hypothetical protein